MPTFTMTQINKDMHKYSNMSLLYHSEVEELFFSKGKIIYLSADKKQKCTLSKNLFSYLHITSRLLRLEPRVVSKISNNQFLIAFKGKIYRYSPLSNSLTVDHSFCSGMNAPLYFCEKITNGIVDVYYGEYYQKTCGKPLAIFRRDGISGEWIKVFEFAPGLIKHIHNVLFDSNKDRFLILTGDSDSESGIWVADSQFKTIKPLLSGSQMYRACFGFIKDDWLYYLTDMPDRTNSAFKVNLATKKVNYIGSISGPCIHGVSFRDGCFFSTSVEPKSTLGKFKYFLSKTLGDGVLDRFSHLYSLKGDDISEITKIKKDCLPFSLFQFGDIFFSKGTDSSVFFCTQALKGGHGKTYVISEDEF